MRLHCEVLFRKLHIWPVVVVIAIALALSSAQVFAAGDAGATDTAAVATEAAAGNAGTGKQYFTGGKRFQNGGPPCMSCHNAGNAVVGALGGGSLGPDLTEVFDNKGFLIDTGWINGKDIPVMGPVFSNHPLTEAEVADLKAFLETFSGQKAPVRSNAPFVGGGIIGTVVMLIIFSIVWSNRYRKRTNTTAHEALWRNYRGKGGR